MRKLNHDNIVMLRYFFYSSGDKVTAISVDRIMHLHCTTFENNHLFASCCGENPISHISNFIFRLFTFYFSEYEL